MLIDDGSTDFSGQICDKYAIEDSRIRVIHQQNRGLAEVRNIGISEAKGDYIQFVDSDDWISPKLVEDAVEYIEKYNVDIVCFRTVSVFPKTVKHTRMADYGVRKMNCSEALSVLFYPQYVDVIACNKFIKKELLVHITYPIGKLYEDMFTTYKIIASAEHILCVSDEYYYYRKNINSIGFRKFTKKTLELRDAVEECFAFCINYPGTDEDALKVGRIKWMVVLANMMIRSGIEDKKFFSKIQKEIAIKKIVRCKYLSGISKLQLVIFKVNIKIYSFVYANYLVARGIN